VLGGVWRRHAEAIVHGERSGGGRRRGVPSGLAASETDAKLAQKLDQLQLFVHVAVFAQECMGQLASFGPP
jgi:hypothetical protein